MTNTTACKTLVNAKAYLTKGGGYVGQNNDVVKALNATSVKRGNIIGHDTWLFADGSYATYNVARGVFLIGKKMGEMV